MLDATAKGKIQARLKRVQGQVGAIQRMVDADTYCVDILVQISAAQAALGQAGRAVLAAHMETCVADAFASGSERNRKAKIDELLDVFSRFGHLGARRG